MENINNNKQEACKILKTRLEQSNEDSNRFKELGFMNLTNASDEIGKKITILSDEICKE